MVGSFTTGIAGSIGFQVAQPGQTRRTANPSRRRRTSRERFRGSLLRRDQHYERVRGGWKRRGGPPLVLLAEAEEKSDECPEHATGERRGEPGVLFLQADRVRLLLQAQH